MIVPPHHPSMVGGKELLIRKYELLRFTKYSNSPNYNLLLSRHDGGKVNKMKYIVRTIKKFFEREESTSIIFALIVILVVTILIINYLSME